MCISNIGSRQAYGSTSTQKTVDTSLFGAIDLKDAMAQRSRKRDAPSNGFSVKADSCTAKGNPHIIMQHNYHDHARDNPTEYHYEHPARGGVTTPFPLKLHELMNDLSRDGYEHVISWQPHGRCFVIHKPKEFAELLPKYFKLSKIASFQRQLNLYGFQRLTKGKDRTGYYHELFLKGRVFLAHNIQRVKVKGTGVRARSNPEQEPDFWSMPWVDDCTSSTSASTPVLDVEPTPISPLALQRAMSNLPLPDSSPVSSTEESADEAFSMNFHFLDPFQTSAGSWTVNRFDDLITSEADSFFEDFDFPDNIGDEIENDEVFGDLLEQMIA